MKARNAALLVGAGTVVAAPLIAKAARPLVAYAIAGGMIAYEAACDAMEHSGEVLRTSFKRMSRRIRRSKAT
jgi:hypothetical protein